MKKVLLSIMVLLVFNSNVYAYKEYTLTENEKFARDTVLSIVKFGAVDLSISKYYNKKFSKINQVLKSLEQSTTSSLSWLRKNATRTPKSAKKIARYERKLINIKSALKKAKLISSQNFGLLKKATYIKNFFKKIPIVEIGMGVYNELDTKNNVKQFIHNYPSAEALVIEGGLENEIIGNILVSAVEILTFGAAIASDTTYEIYDSAPNASHNRKNFFAWFKAMESSARDFKVFGKYAIHSNGTKTLINNMPVGLKQYFRITTNALVSKISKKEFDDMKLIKNINNSYIEGEAKNSSNGLYSDVYKYSNLYKNIQTLVSLDVIYGYTDGTFKPQIVVTQKEALEMMIKLFYKNEFKLYVNNINNTKKDIYSFIEDKFSTVPLARWHDWNKKDIATNFQMAELLMRVLYKKINKSNLTNKTYSDNKKLTYFKVYVGTINNKNGWDVFSTGLKALGIIKENTSGKFVKDEQVARLNIVNLLARTYRFAKMRGAL